MQLLDNIICSNNDADDDEDDDDNGDGDDDDGDWWLILVNNLIHQFGPWLLLMFWCLRIAMQRSVLAEEVALKSLWLEFLEVYIGNKCAEAVIAL